MVAAASASPATVLVPMAGAPIPAGFPSPADDFQDESLCLNALLIKNQPATHFVRVRGVSMVKAGIFDGDVLVVDRSIEARSGMIVVASYSGRYTVKRLFLEPHSGAIELRPEADDPAYQPYRLRDGEELDVFGVVTSTIKQFIR